MSKLSRSSVFLDVEPGAERAPVEPDSETPFRILLIGDFSGRANRRAAPAERLRPVLVDRDNFDDVLARMGAALRLGGEKQGITLPFRELEDFHPDRIYEQPLFAALREKRRGVAEGLPPAAPPAEARPAAPPEPSRLASGSLLEDMLEATESGPAKPARRPDELRAFIERAVAPHLTPKEDPRVPKLQAAVDEETGKVMRAILHHPDFQALEAAWRGVFLLIQGLETGTQLKLYLLDLSKAELAASTGKLHRLLVEDTSIPGAEPWAVVAGNFAFSRREADVALLGGLARIMQAAGAPFLAECDPAGDADSQEAARMWSALRHSPEAAWIGLALPRFLLRLPYGKNTDRLESFAFEEMPGKPEHGRYLWGNPAFACVYLLGQAFSSRGWEMRPGLFQELRGLPLHAYEADGEQRLQPCAETWMTEKDADWIMEQGFMPLASIKNQDAVRLVRFQSIADPPRALAGRWGG